MPPLAIFVPTGDVGLALAGRNESLPGINYDTVFPTPKLWHKRNRLHVGRCALQQWDTEDKSFAPPHESVASGPKNGFGCSLQSVVFRSMRAVFCNVEVVLSSAASRRSLGDRSRVHYGETDRFAAPKSRPAAAGSETCSRARNQRSRSAGDALSCAEMVSAASQTCSAAPQWCPATSETHSAVRNRRPLALQFGFASSDFGAV